MTTNELILDTINKMENAGSVVVYGAGKRAELMIPFCEAFVSKDKIQVAVSSLGGGVTPFIYDHPVRAIGDVYTGSSTVVMVAAGEHYFDEICQMPQVKKAGAVVCLEYAQVLAAKRYTILHRMQKLGIDLRLFDRIPLDALVDRKQDSFRGLDSISGRAARLATDEAASYVVRNMRTAKAPPTRDAFHIWLQAAIRQNQTPGGINMEFGVAWGESLQKFAGEDINIFYGFDSFEGLPETYAPGYEKGKFDVKGQLPAIPNVELVKGWFDETLPAFVRRRDIAGKKADFIHIDCDLYSSTKTVFENIAPFIREGTLIAFDEYFNYPGWREGEYKAFQEFVEANHIRYEYLAYADTDAQVCVRIKEKK